MMFNHLSGSLMFVLCVGLEVVAEVNSQLLFFQVTVHKQVSTLIVHRTRARTAL